MHKRLLALLACPKCGGELEYQRKKKTMVCHKDKLVFPVRNGIPVLLEMDAKALTETVK